MAQQCGCSTEGQHRGTFLSAAAKVVVVVEDLSLQCYQCVRDMKIRPTVRLTLFVGSFYETEQVQYLNLCCEQTQCFSAQLAGAQDTVV
jgi:hypothetical protein